MTPAEKQTSSSDEWVDYMEAFLRCGGIVSMDEFQHIDEDQKAALIVARQRIRSSELAEIATMITTALSGIFHGDERKNPS